MTKRVLILSLSYFPKHVGGAEVAVKEITDRIDPGEYEFHLITNRYDSTLPKLERIGNVTVYRIGIATENPSMADLKQFPLNINKPLFQFLAAWKAIRLHRKLRFSIMWAMMAHSTGVPAAIIKLVHPEIRYVLNLQEGDPIPYVECTMRPLWPLFTRAFTRADMVQAISNYLADWARRRAPRVPVEVIPNGVDVRRFTQVYAVSELDTLRAQLGKPGDTLLITTSRLVHKNAVDDVIRALPLVPPHVRFIILGTGPDESMLRALAAALGVADRIDFIGHVQHDDLPKYLQASDIFIRPSRSEGMGASFVEAMAAGLPVIATQEGGIADFLFDAKRNPERATTGWAVDANSPEQIAKAVSAIMADARKVGTVTEAAKKMVIEKYNWDTIANDMKARVLDRLSRG